LILKTRQGLPIICRGGRRGGGGEEGEKEKERERGVIMCDIGHGRK